MPEVPSIEMPPRMPSRGLKVFLAITSPFSQPMRRSKPAPCSVPAIGFFRQHFGDRLPHHLARHRIDRRLPDGYSQTGLGRYTDADAGEKAYLPSIIFAHLGKDGRAVGIIRIIAAIFQYFGAYRGFVQPVHSLDRHQQIMGTVRQRHAYLFVLFAMQQQIECGFNCGATAAVRAEH